MNIFIKTKNKIKQNKTKQNKKQINEKKKKWQKITTVTFSPNGKLLVSGSSDESIIVWDVEDGSILKKITGNLGRVWRVAYSPDSKFIASVSISQTIRIWSTENWQPYRTINTNETVILF